MLLEPYSLKNTSSPRRRLRLGIFLEKSYLHCPPSVMGSLCPNGLTAFLVRQVQLLVVLVQVPHLYLSPKCLRALRTTSRPEKLSIDFESRVCDLSPEAVTVSSSGGAASPRTTATASATIRPPPTDFAATCTDRLPFSMAKLPTLTHMPLRTAHCATLLPLLPAARCR